MLRLSAVSLYRGAKRVLHEVSFTVHAGQKTGVIGANGAGKTSLLALVAGHLASDSGEVRRPDGLRVAEVAQDLPAGSRALLDYVLDGDHTLRALEQALATARAAGDGEHEAELLARYDDAGGYTAEARAARILAGLGFATRTHARPLGELSGGWQVRAALARALVQPSDMMLLDEPTNHLDLDAVVWLEDWLRGYAGSLLLISHDREFLDAVVTQTLHVHDQRVDLYAGGYSQFERARAQALSLQRKTSARQQREVARIQRFVERFRFKASKARQAQSRLKTLERMQAIVPAHVDAPFRLRAPVPDRLPGALVTLDRVAVGYGSSPVLDGLEMNVSPGMRLGLLGRNGAGKSTLVRLLAGALAPTGGTRHAATGLVCGYFAQHRLEQLRDDESALTQLLRQDPALSEQVARELLGRFGFSGDDALRSVSTLSGGERARLVLALVFQRRPNLLLLDEPTNHLDLEMRHALVVALQSYTGAIVLVSHDRFLLRSVSDELWLVRDGGAARYDGDLDDYARWLRRNRERSADATQQPREAATRTRREQPASGPAPARKLGFNEQRELDGLPVRIEQLEAEQQRLQRELADPDFYRFDRDRVGATRKALARIEQDLDAAYARWSELDR